MLEYVFKGSDSSRQFRNHGRLVITEYHSPFFSQNSLTLLPGLGNDISGRLAHHLGDVERAVGLLGDGDGPVHRLCLHLVVKHSQ